MKKFILAAMLAVVGFGGAAVVAPQKAEAQVYFGFGAGPGWGHRHYYGPPAYAYGGPRYVYGGPRYYAPSCWWQRRVVDTPWGPRWRRVRVCN